MNLYESKYTAAEFETAIKAVLDPYGEGKKAEYDRFWDAYQEKGMRQSYGDAFAGYGWSNETFKPKYDIVPVGDRTANLFYGTGISGSLPEILNGLGVRLDCKDMRNASNMFHNSEGITEIGELNLQSATNVNAAFASTQVLQRIEKLIISDTGTLTFSSTFSGARALSYIRFEGVIGRDISFSASGLLTNESAQSIIDHLKDLTGQTAQTLTFHATVGGNLTAAQKAAITAKNWTLVY